MRGIFINYPLEPSEENAWTVILNRFGSVSDFLPRLTELGALHITPKGPLSESFLLSPALRHLSLEPHPFDCPDKPESGPLLTAALEHVIAAIPSLSSLKIDRGPEGNISWMMPPFQSIRDLDITPRLRADASVLTVIGQFHYLRTLSMRIADDCAHLQGCLQSLTELRIGGRALHIQSFLVATAPPLLQGLALFFMQDPSTEHLMQCISVMLATVPFTLSTLVLESNITLNPTLASAMDVIQPALVLRSLTSFAFKIKPLPSISDTDLTAMITAWPLLTTLRIPKGHHPGVASGEQVPPGSRPTAAILPAIAARCPHLRSLELPEVDLGSTPALDALPPPLSPAHGLRALDLTSRCADRHACMRAAVMLDRLFPRMELPLIRGGMYGDGEKGEKGWAAVVGLLGAMQAGRKHGEAFERMWGERGGEDDGGDGGGSGSGSEGGEQDQDQDQDGGDEDEDEDGIEYEGEGEDANMDVK